MCRDNPKKSMGLKSYLLMVSHAFYFSVGPLNLTSYSCIQNMYSKYRWRGVEACGVLNITGNTLYMCLEPDKESSKEPNAKKQSDWSIL